MGSIVRAKHAVSSGQWASDLPVRGRLADPGVSDCVVHDAAHRAVRPAVLRLVIRCQRLFLGRFSGLSLRRNTVQAALLLSSWRDAPSDS